MPKSDTNSVKSHAEHATVHELQEIAVQLREKVIQMLLNAGAGHSAGSLGSADIIATLYFHTLNVDPENPLDPERDRFILSNGHVCPVLYAALQRRGYFGEEELWKFHQSNALLQGHPYINPEIGIENTSGSLGIGLSLASGMALAAKMDEKTYRIYCMTSDGELNEGNTWEAAMFAPNKNLTNLTWIIDRNNIQIDGYTENVMPLENLREKLEAFNWFVLEVDGHNIEELINAFNMSRAVAQRPTAIIAHTIPGKGVDFMEYKFEWHSKPPNKKEAEEALRDLRTLEGKLKYTHV